MLWTIIKCGAQSTDCSTQAMGGAQKRGSSFRGSPKSMTISSRERYDSTRGRMAQRPLSMRPYTCQPHGSTNQEQPMLSLATTQFLCVCMCTFACVWPLLPSLSIFLSFSLSPSLALNVWQLAGPILNIKLAALSFTWTRWCPRGQQGQPGQPSPSPRWCPRGQQGQPGQADGKDNQDSHDNVLRHLLIFFRLLPSSAASWRFPRRCRPCS